MNPSMVKLKRLTEDETLELLKIRESNPDECYHRLIEHNLPLIYTIVKDFRWDGAAADWSDLVNQGVIALHEAIRRYDFNRVPRVPFGSYAGHMIRWGLSNYLLSLKPIALTTNKWSHIKNGKCSDWMKDFYKNGITRSVLETSEEESAVSSSRGVYESPRETLEMNDIHARIREIVRSFDQRERDIMTMRYDLDNVGHRAMLREISQMFKISRQRVQQIEIDCIKKIRQCI